MDLNTLWFLIIGFVLTVYVILDGYDLGIGILCLFVPRRKHEYREQLIQIIGPYWDGNEVWLIVFGGMLFAVFPRVYAVLLSALYLPFIVLLIFFIIRGISIPSRNAYNTDRWHGFWDLSFGLSSLMIAFLLGLVAANLIRGITSNENGFMKLNLARLISPFSLWMGFFSIALLCMHGAIHAGRKCAGDLGFRFADFSQNGVPLKSYCRKAGLISWLLMLIFAVPAEITVLSHDPADVFKKYFLLFSLLAVLLIVSIVYIPWGLKSGRFNKTFAASSLAIGRFLALLYLYSYPNLLRSVEPARNLTIYNAASSGQAMLVALILTIIAMPIVIGYTIYAHHTLAQHELPAINTPYDAASPKSRSNFLLLCPLLKPFKDRWEPAATANVPLVFVLLLLLLPFYGRNKKHSPLYRPLAVLGGFTLVAWFSVYTILGGPHFAIFSQNGNPAHYSKQRASLLANAAVSVQASTSVKAGAELFSSQGCAGCHTIHGHGGNIGPDLSVVGSQGHSDQWLTTQIRNPKAHDPATVMPSFNSLSAEQVKNLVDYLQSLRSSSSRPAQGTEPTQTGGSTNEPNAVAATATSGPNEPSGSTENKTRTSQDASLISKGKSLFHSEGCIDCHRVDGSGGHIGPNLSDVGSEGLSRQWLTVQIRNPKKHDPESIMPSFASLSNENLNALMTYIESLKGPSGPTASSQSAGSPEKSAVESQAAPTAPQSNYPGTGTYKFIAITIAGFAIAVLFLVVLWLRFMSDPDHSKPARPGQRPEDQTGSPGKDVRSYNERLRSSSEEDKSANSFGTYHKKQESDEPSASSASFALIVILIVAIIATAVILIFSTFVTTKPIPSVTTRHISSQQANQSGASATNTGRPANDRPKDNKD